MSVEQPETTQQTESEPAQDAPVLGEAQQLAESTGEQPAEAEVGVPRCL